MNNLYRSVVSSMVLSSMALMAQPQGASVQSLRQPKAFSPGDPAMAPVHPHANAYGNGERATFYTEDFSGGGIPAGWTNVDDLTPSGQVPVTFQWANTPGAVTPAAAGQPLILTFAAPGASNGFLWANADRGLASAPPSYFLSRLTTSAINCSGQPSVLLTMQSTIGVFVLDADTACKIRVSTDGTNWTSFAPFPCLKAGNINPPCERFSYNPQQVAVDISSVAANQPVVYIQFQWRGGWEYYWAIDDLQLSSLPEHEMVMDFGYTSQTGGGYEFGRVPANQMPASLNVGAQIRNFGSADQTNVVVNVSLRDQGNAVVGSATTNVGTMLHNDTMVTNENIVLNNPMSPGIYTAHFTVTSDQIDQDENMGNNESFRYFAVTNDLYSIDAIGVVPDSILATGSLGTASFADNAQDVRLLNYYPINVQQAFTGVEIRMDPARTDAGSYFIAAVYDTADVQIGAALASPLVESDPRVITASDIANGFAQVAFISPITLPVGAYYVAARMYQEAGNDLFILDDLTVPQPFTATMLWTPVDDQNQFLYSNGNAMAIRLSSSPNVAVQETSNLAGVTMYPSPTNGPVEVHVSAAGKMTVEVFNALGKLVSTSSFNGTSTKVDLTGNSAGIYTVRVSDGARYNVQRITLK